jgi:alkylation response protein AidB-like acyl-CoA dehydrogenase
VNDVFFADCFIPAENVVGDIGRGFGQIMGLRG